MKLVFRVFLFGLLVSANFSQILAATSLKLSTKVIDLGDISDAGGVINRTITFTNSGTDSLQIIAITTICNCITANWTKTLVAPGSTGVITVYFDPRDRTGLFSKILTVTSNDQSQKNSIELKGNVISAYSGAKLAYSVGVLATHSKHVNLGYVYKGETKDKDLRVANYSQKPLKVELINLPQHITARVIPEILKPEEFGVIEIIYNSDLIDDWDFVIDRLGLRLNGVTDTTIRLPVKANIRENFDKLTPEQKLRAPVAVFSSDTNEFVSIDRKENLSCKFLIRNDGKSNLIIRSVKASCGCMVLKPEKSVLTPGDSTFIEAIYKPEPHEGKFIKNLTVITNDPQNYKHILWIKGNVE
jgi:hypothetical protein